LFDWVSYPITVLIEELYRFEMSSFERDVVPSPGSPYRLELLAALERTLCFCHTGSTAVFATTLMNPLGLSRSAIKDGLPMLLPVFKQDCVHAAKEHGFEIDPRRWPLKNGYPAMASKKAQVYTYSLSHFMVSPFAVRRSPTDLFRPALVIPVRARKHLMLASLRARKPRTSAETFDDLILPRSPASYERGDVSYSQCSALASLAWARTCGFPLASPPLNSSFDLLVIRFVSFR
jgi:hypothetical protein